MNYSRRKKIKAYNSMYHNQDEDEQYPQRVWKPVAVLLLFVIVAVLAISAKLIN